MTRVFISHSTRDRDLANDWLIPLLDDNEVPYWYAPEGIVGGEHWEQEIREALDKCDTLLVVVSKDAAASQWVHAEVSIALRLGRRVVPVVIDDTSPDDIHTLLVRVQHVVYSARDPEASAQRVLAALRGDARGTRTVGTRSRRRRAVPLWLVLGVLAAAVGAAAWVVWRPEDRPPPRPVDPRPPALPTVVVRLTSPTPNSFVSSRVVQVKGETKGLPDGAKLVLNGQVFEDVGPAFDKSVAAAVDGALRVDAAIESDGKVVARDALFVKVDTAPPVVTITFPEQEEVLSPRMGLVITGTAQDDHLSHLLVDGSAVNLRQDGRFAWPVTLAEGKTITVKVSAQDQAGNRSVPVMRRITHKAPVAPWKTPLDKAMEAGRALDWNNALQALEAARKTGVPSAEIPAWLVDGVGAWSAPPKITLNSPKSGDRIVGLVVELKGFLVNPRRTDELFVDGVRQKLFESAFLVRKQYPSSGSKTIQMEVRDGKEVRAETSLTVNLDAAAPPPRLAVIPDARVPDTEGPMIPSVLGYIEAAARVSLRKWDVVVERTLDVASLGGVIVNQRPSAGKTLAHAERVTIVLAEHQQRDGEATVPNVEGKILEGAAQTLARSGFTAKWGAVESTDLQRGLVLGQTPLPGSLAQRGSSVEVVVGKGPTDTGPSLPALPVPKSLLIAPSLANPPKGESYPHAYGATFEWSAVPGAQRYEWELQEELPFVAWKSLQTLERSDTQYRPVKMQRGRYRWRVRAIGKDGPGAWSEFRRLYMY